MTKFRNNAESDCAKSGWLPQLLCDPFSHAFNEFLLFWSFWIESEKDASESLVVGIRG